MILMVTGGRRYGEFDLDAVLADRKKETLRVVAQVKALRDALDKIHRLRGITELVEGGCKTGTDRLSKAWAQKNGIMVVTYPADWSKGRGGGPRRNTKMVNESGAQGCLATEGGDGTADCISKCEKAGIPVMKVVSA